MRRRAPKSSNGIRAGTTDPASTRKEQQAMSTQSRRRMAKVVQQARLIHVLVVCLTLVQCLGIGGRWTLDPTQGGINSRLARLAFTEIGTAVLVVLEGFPLLHWARWSFAQILPEGRAAQPTAIKRNEP